MNFFIESTIGCTITLLGYWYVSDILFQKKSKKDILGLIMIIICAAIATYLNILGNSINIVIRTLIVFVMMFLFNKNKYKEKILDTFLKTFMVYINFYLADILLLIILSLSSKITNINLSIVLQYSLVGNILATVILIIMMRYTKTLYIKLLNRLQNYNLNLIISISIVLMTIALLLTQLPTNDFKFNLNLVTTMTLIIMLCFIGIYMIKQKSEIDNVTDKYSKLAKYSKNNEGLLEEYRMNLHENKNRLIRIDNMVPDEYKEIHEYIEELIEINRSNKYYWLTELKYVPSSELKGFMNYKIIEMMNDKIQVEVNISRELNTKILKNYSVKEKEDLYSIVGILLDNAHEASKSSKEKSVSIQMYMNNKDLVLIVANTFKGKINIEKIDEYGYSSKGKNRGTGLHIVNEIVNRSELFEKETGLLDNYFVQTITIKSKKLKKKKV